MVRIVPVALATVAVASWTMPRVPGLWRTRDEVAPIWPGTNHPLGSTWSEESTNFAVWAPEATAAYVCLVDDDGAEVRHRLTEQSLGIWHGAIPGVELGQRYGYRMAGPWQPALGLRFNPQKLLLDPYARAVSGTLVQDPAIFGYAVGALETRDLLDSGDKVPLSVVVDDRFDWQDDAPQRRRWRDTVIYELHVKGMTQLHDRVPEPLRGTYAGLATPAVTDYLRDLGVTAVELLPVHQFVHRAGGGGPRAEQLLGLQLDRLLRARTRRTRPPATAASRSPSSSRWSRPSTRPASR